MFDKTRAMLLLRDFGTNIRYSILEVLYSVFLVVTTINLLSILRPTIFATAYRITFPTAFDVLFTEFWYTDLLLIASTGAAILVFCKPKLKIIALGAIYVVFGGTTIIWQQLVIPFLVVSALLIIILPLVVKRYTFSFSFLKVTIVFLVMFSALEILSLTRWLSYPVFYSRIYEDLSWIFARREALISSLLGAATPYLLITLTVGFSLKLIIGSSKKIELFLKQFCRSFREQDFFERNHRILLGFALGLPVIIVAYSYLPTINPNYTIGWDAEGYLQFNEELQNSSSLQEYLRGAFIGINQGDRSLTLIVVNLIVTLLSPIVSALDTIRIILPMMLGVLLVYSAYRFVRETSNERLAVIAALMTALSHQVIVGIYGGLLANWLALSILFVLFWLLARLYVRFTIRNFVFAVVAGMALLFTHIYTWNFFILVGSVILTITLVEWFSRGRKGIPVFGLALFFIIVLTIGADFGRSLIGAASGIFENAEIARSQTDLENFSLRWNNLLYAMAIRYGGAYENMVVILLAIGWWFKFDRRSYLDKVVFAFLIASVLPLLFGDLVVQSRIIYNLPIQFPAAITLWRITKSANPSLTKIFVVFVFAYLLTYAFRNAANFYLILPT